MSRDDGGGDQVCSAGELGVRGEGEGEGGYGQGPKIVWKLGWGVEKFRLKMCGESGKFSTKIGIPIYNPENSFRKLCSQDRLSG